jgi:hypothetical protein
MAAELPAARWNDEPYRDDATAAGPNDDVSSGLLTAAAIATAVLLEI